jgi:hypothetical protein
VRGALGAPQNLIENPDYAKEIMFNACLTDTDDTAGKLCHCWFVLRVL